MSERWPASGPLLTIDVEAEVRKLCSQQLSSNGALLAELIRLAVACGATEVSLTLGWREARLTALTARLPPACAVDLATIADASQPDEARHASLVRCEATYGSALLALLGLERARLSFGDGERWRELELCRGVPVEVSEARPRGTVLEVVVPRAGPRAGERASVRRACRFARVPIRIDGVAASGGDPVAECLVCGEAPSPLGKLWVGLPRAAELGLTVILHHEVVLREWYGTSRQGYVHTALLRRDGPPVSVGSLQEPLVALVAERREALFATLRRRFVDLAPADRAAASSILFRRAERSRRLDELDGVPLFARLDGRAVDLKGLREAAGGGLYAVEPGARPRRYLVGPTEIFVLDARAREFLLRAAALGVQEPPVLQPPTWWRAAAAGLRACVDLGRRAARAASSLVFGARIVPAARLTPAEAALLVAISAEIKSGRFRLPGLSQAVSSRVSVAMSERAGLPAALCRRGERWFWLLPRRHPALALRGELAPVRLHPLMLVLAGGFDGYGLDKERIHRAAFAERS